MESREKFVAKDKDAEEQRTYGMVSVAVPVGKLTRPVFGRHGFVSGALVMDWPAIVGSAVASHTMPIRIKFPPKERAEGTLIVKVASSAFATELQHLEPLILDRINGHFGYKAVARLKLIHGPLPLRLTAKPLVESSLPLAGGTAALLETVEDPELRAVLERLGRRISSGG